MTSLDLPVLKLNSLWQVIESVSVRKSFEDAAAGAVKLLRLEEGYPILYEFPEWCELGVQDGQDFVCTSSDFHSIKKIQCPRVAVCENYSKFRAKEQKCNKENLHRRYGGKDAWGNPLALEDASREHVTPQSKGGKDGWHNEVPMHKLENSRRGNNPYEEVGLTEPKILPPPPPLLPINMLVNTRGWPEWQMFHIPGPEETA